MLTIQAASLLPGAWALAAQMHRGAVPGMARGRERDALAGLAYRPSAVNFRSLRCRGPSASFTPCGRDGTIRRRASQMDPDALLEYARAVRGTFVLKHLYLRVALKMAPDSLFVSKEWLQMWSGIRLAQEGAPFS
ncbi:hypothetical protein HPB50_009028 [Hyalomma asiaticum]|uniref:Uncharacterized protein n=1 Tax=Hyalomma asiaticum TaxID=266040 RepID=A0ACB7STU5_HYAAI|nr:hypothetical protein HPB50_009028 [Hyalomma asiaticum]